MSQKTQTGRQQRISINCSSVANEESIATKNNFEEIKETLAKLSNKPIFSDYDTITVLINEYAKKHAKKGSSNATISRIVDCVEKQKEVNKKCAGTDDWYKCRRIGNAWIRADSNVNNRAISSWLKDADNKKMLEEHHELYEIDLHYNKRAVRHQQ